MEVKKSLGSCIFQNVEAKDFLSILGILQMFDKIRSTFRILPDGFYELSSMKIFHFISFPSLLHWDEDDFFFFSILLEKQDTLGT